jgi:hypothetical protein
MPASSEDSPCACRAPFIFSYFVLPALRLTFLLWHQTSDADWNLLFDLNARSVLHAVRAVVP